MNHNSPHFAIGRDKTSPYFCEACLVGKSEASPDPHYCRGCYEFLLEEADMLSPRQGRPAWIPKRQKPQKVCEKQPPMQLDMGKQGEVLLHTKTKDVHAYQNHTEDRPKVNLGGRPRKDVPIKLIHRLSEQGLSIKKIVKELKKKEHIISAMTVSRVLSGQRETNPVE